MSDLALPPPHDDGAPPPAARSDDTASGRRRRSDQSRTRNRRKSAQSKPLTVEEIMSQLNSLKGMVAAGWIKPASANAITRILQLMLHGLQRAGPHLTSSGLPEEILADLARKDPVIMNLLADFLTDEQFDAIMASEADENPAQESGDPRDGQV